MNYEKIIEKIEKKLNEYLKNRKAIIGISGGLDSAVVAALCARAIGRENVFGILMPYSSQDMEDAKLLVEQLGIKSKEINIQEAVDKFNFIELNNISKGNVMARARMIILYMFANEFSGLVIGTGNKSEMELGYFTKYGDGGVDIEPIGNFYKTEIFEIAKILQIPEKIINKKPSAGLWDSQTDEDEIGATYKEIDSILKGGITKGEIFEKINKMIKNSEHKRKMPEVLKIRENGI